MKEEMRMILDTSGLQASGLGRVKLAVIIISGALLVAWSLHAIPGETVGR